MKTPKRNRKSPKTPLVDERATVESVLDDSIELLAFGQQEIRKEIELIVNGKAAKSRHDKGSRIAFLTGRIGAIADSIRKVEGARAKRVEKLTPSQVLAWLRLLDESERAAFLREAQRIDQEGSVLS